MNFQKAKPIQPEGVTLNDGLFKEAKQETKESASRLVEHITNNNTEEPFFTDPMPLSGVMRAPKGCPEKDKHLYYQNKLLPYGYKGNYSEAIGVYVINYEPQEEETKAKLMKKFGQTSKVALIGKGVIHQRMNTHITKMRADYTNKEQTNWDDSLSGAKALHENDPNIHNYSFQYCVMKSDRLALCYEDKLIKKYKPLCNKQHMAGK